MNKEIKFRVWGKKENSFIENCLIGGGLVFRAILPMVIPVLKEDVEVQQFTGLLDVNGKEIYEGDIVAAPLISQDASMQDAQIVPTILKLLNFVDDISNAEFYSDMEVVGNIFENPELLK